ncbi:MAG: glycosyltransferase [Verrucomicrobia bacterium]|nr:glycosyltransferase [Verrucomicrobiota bacterium]
MEAEEERLLERADIVLTSSAGLAEKAHGSLLVRNGVEFDYFSRKPDVVKRPSARPVVGYYGAIADWFDMKLVLKAAQMFPEWDFWLIGAAYPAHRQAARDQSNIIWAGEVPYAELTAYLYGMDVCMIPFLENKLTRCTNPVKVYEYLAAGKPVVATALPELELMREHVQVAHNHDEFLACLRDAMANSGTSSEVEGRIAWAAQHDWSKRAGQIEGAIHGRVPLVSVIVLTHNQIEKTKACLNSLLELTDYPNFEILVVDNASSDGTIEYVSQLASRDGRVQLITNSSNTGFPAGSNIGLRAARGEYFVLLNNDTVCTRGWLRGLVRHLMKDARLGAVGPVTNNIGNEARIKVSYSDMEEMAVAARRYTVDHLRQLLFVEKIAFFCVAFSRRVYEQVGPLDERFGLGLFEDDDYCNRIRSLGYKIAICEDVFIHHELSASFGELAKDTHESLFEKNRQYYEEKWGVWWPHFYRKIR